MNAIQRKQVSAITKYAIDEFSHGDWYTLGQLTDHLELIDSHPRLLRSLGFGDDDYDACAAEVLNTIFSTDEQLIGDVIDHYDIDLWFEQKYPNRFQRVFGQPARLNSDFWESGYFKAFISHLSENKGKASRLKESLLKWGVSSFIAHEDIQATREWRNEVEAGLDTMDVLIAIVEPGFKESDWCAQEIGYALGRRVDIIPLRAGMDPFGFFGKYQGLQVKGRQADDVAMEIVQLLLNKPTHRHNLIESMGRAFASVSPISKRARIKLIDAWDVISDDLLKLLLEGSFLSSDDKKELSEIITKAGAFQEPAVSSPELGEDIPF